MPAFLSKIQNRLSGSRKSSSSPKWPSSSPDDSNDSSQVPKTTPSTKSILSKLIHRDNKDNIDVGPPIYEPDTRLLNIDALLNDEILEPTKYQRAWFGRVNVAVRDYMNNTDASHDYMHSVRVVINAHRLYLAEKHHHWVRDIDPMVIYTAALVHDIGDDEDRDMDAGSMESIEPDEAKQDRQCNTIQDLLDSLKCPPQVAGPAAYIASFVSFEREMNNPEPMKVAMSEVPALRIVQDADRLDALGALGMSRASRNGGDYRNDAIPAFLKLIDERFVHYPGLMKTKTGRKEAEKAWAYMVEFKARLSDLEGREAMLDFA